MRRNDQGTRTRRSRACAGIAGRTGLPAGRIDTPFQQTDLPTSLADLPHPGLRTSDQGIFLRLIRYRQRGAARAGRRAQRVDVVLRRARRDLLKGDDSEWIGDRPGNWQQIEDAVHRDRIQRGVLDSDIEQLIEILGR